MAMCAALLLAGCTDTAPEPPRTEAATTRAPLKSQQESLRQTDSQGQQLPFKTRFPNRWNRSNDGTQYEPCTGPSPEILDSIGIDASTARDAGTVDGQSLRGCEWMLRMTPPNQQWRASQFVINSQSLNAYKDKYKDEKWRPNSIVDGREVGITTSEVDGCWTYVQSQAAGVITQVSYFGEPQPPTDDLCNRAMQLTRATISKIPR